MPATTRMTELLDIEFPIFAFSHCRDVVAAVSRAGGFGVLGALAYTPDELEVELVVDRRPLRRQALRRRPRDARQLHRQGRRGGGQRSVAAGDDPGRAPRVRRPRARRGRHPASCPTTSSGAGARAAGLDVDAYGLRCRSTSPCSTRPACSSTPSARRRRTSSTGPTTTASSSPPSSGAKRHAERQVEPGRRHHRRPGRRGRWAHRRRRHDGPRARGASTPSARTCPSSPPAGSAPAGRWPPPSPSAPTACGPARSGSPWPSRAPSPHVVENLLVGRLARHRALAVDDRQAGPPAAHGVDRGVGARGRAGHPADAAAGPAVRRRRAALRPGARSPLRRLAGRSDRRPDERRAPGQGCRLRRWSRSGSRPSPASTTMVQQ